MGSQRHNMIFPATEPDHAIPPGETLRGRLEELGMSQVDLARRTGLTTKHVNQVLKGAAAISADVAQRLEYATGTPARWWLRLEADYRATQTRLSEQERASSELEWSATMPVGALVRAGAIPAEPSDPTHRLRQLLQFFGVASVNAYRQVWRQPAAAFRQSHAYAVEESAVTSWLRLGELAAQHDPITNRFDPDTLRTLLPTFRALTRQPLRDAVQGFVQGCRESGISVVFVPEITGARAYGATRWVGGARHPLVQLSLRGRTDDKLWLTAFHELGHVLLHDRRSIFIESDDSGSAGYDEAEAEANAFAWSQLVPEHERCGLHTLRNNEDVLDFAESIGIAASIVVARLQGDGLWTYRQGARLKRPVSPELLAAVESDTDSERSRRRRSRHLPGG